MTIDYKTATQTLNGRKKRKIGNNTYLEQIDEVFIIRLHNTDIIKIYPDDTQVIHTGGYRTATTKNRINEYSFVSVSQKDYSWYLQNGEDFFDGIRVDRTGEVIK